MAKLILTKEIAKRLSAICDDPSHYKVTHNGVAVTHVVVTVGGMTLYEEGEKHRYMNGDTVQISVYERQDDYFS